MFLHLLLAILAYAGILLVIDAIKIPDPGPRVAKIVVSIIFVVTVLNEFGVFQKLNAP